MDPNMIQGRAGEVSVIEDGHTPDEVFVELNAVETELVQRCGTLLLLNSRLIELNYILRERFPKRAPQELDTKIRSMREAQYQTVFEERTRLQQENTRLEQHEAKMKEVEIENEQLTASNQELRELNARLSEAVESRTEDKYTIACAQGRAYMQSLETQVAGLSLENRRIRENQQAVTDTGNEAIGAVAKAEASHKDAIRDLQALSAHLEYLDRQALQMEEKAEASRVQLNQSQQQCAGLKQQLNLMKDQNVASGMLIDQDDAGAMSQQVARYQEELSVMQVEKLQMEEGLKNQLDHERERVDKYRAKFESSKTHIRELENTVHDLQLANAQLEASLQTLQNSMFQQRPDPNPPVRRERGHSSSSEDNGEGPAGGPDPAGGKMLWGKRKRVIFQSENKRRMEVEWCFVTTDGVPHAVVLQHTQQENKTKTRRRLTVDGILKYDDKSSATSFRIEINRDVLVVGIKRAAGRTFQYELQVNDEDYQVAFQKWKEQRYQQ